MADADQIEAALAQGEDILRLATSLLRLCRRHLDALVTADGDPRNWRARETLRRRCVELFEDVDDEELDPDERQRLTAVALDGCRRLPPIIVAHAIAEALDATLGERFLPMHLNRQRVLAPDDPVPAPHPDWRAYTPSPNSDPWALDGRLDALPHLRLAGDWARHVEVTLDGSWRTWNGIPQLRPGDRLACAVPNEELGELTMTRAEVEGRAVFFDVRPRALAEQRRRCLALLDLARRQQCRLVVFPELSVPKSVLDAMASWLDGQEVVEMIVAGSRHRRGRSGGWHNLATALIRGARTRLEHRKFRPFTFADRAADGAPVRRTEYLASRQPGLRAYLSPHWTMAMLICKDAVVEPMPRLLADLRANLVLVPALTFKVDAFRALAGDVATWAQAIAVVANAGLAPRPRMRRLPVILGLPSQGGSVTCETPPARSLLLVTLGTDKKNPAFVAATLAPDPAPQPPHPRSRVFP